MAFTCVDSVFMDAALRGWKPIGYIQSDFKEKFGVPRQSLMIADARARLKLNADARYADALRHLETFSHVWVVFLFDQNGAKEWSPTISPPRIDAPARVGVFASRSPHRPNPIGISAVKLEKIDLQAAGGIEIELSGVDFLDGTAVLDLKPYLPYADSIPSATSGWAGSEIPRYAVHYSEVSLQTIESYSRQEKVYFKNMLQQMLELDPRPTSQRRLFPITQPENEGKEFLFRLLDFDIHWKIQQGAIQVIRLIELKKQPLR